MPTQLAQMCATLNPLRTALLLGAGASVPSGAPTGAQLAELLWQRVAKLPSQSDDLVETSTLLERRYSRREVVDAIAGRLAALSPTGGLLAIPRFGWRRVYTTNFDQLVERSYADAHTALVPVKSNFDFPSVEHPVATVLYKIHGCISEDRAFGHRASMILTEQDYEDYARYRQSLFAHLQSDLLSGDVLIVGQSLRDRHLHDLIRKVLTFKSDGAPGSLFVLVYDRDDLRASILEDRGAKVVFGGIDEFVHELSSAPVPTPQRLQVVDSDTPTSLVSAVVQVVHAIGSEPNVLKMFNGSAASYADIAAGATFERASEGVLLACFGDGSKRAVSIIGPAGSGKTTLARRLLTQLHSQSIIAYEHRVDFPFQSEPWIAYEATLRERGRRAVLLLDECTKYLRQVNLLVTHLGQLETSALTLVLTANAAQWSPRIKSPAVFARGHIQELGRLVAGDIHGLINLVERSPTIAALTQPAFRRQTRGEQFDALRRRCDAEMFVCLKLIFGNENLDQIVLREFNQLDATAQDYYRYIAALESVGMRVHRQLALRMLGMRADQVAAVLGSLVGIVDEYEISEEDGLYGWSTRHLVIARKITEYKFSSLEELGKLFASIVEQVNPTVRTELQSIRDICDVEFGIGRLADSATRMTLYESLVRLAPGERIPWHRLIREVLSTGDYERAEQVLREAALAVRSDAPIDRYRVQLLVARAKNLPGLSKSDRLALLRKAYEQAMRNIERHTEDKTSYRVLCEVAVERCDFGDTQHILAEAVNKMRSAANKILDPDLLRDLRHFEGVYARIATSPPPVA